jgi:hypothetical protein
MMSEKLATLDNHWYSSVFVKGGASYFYCGLTRFGA